MQSFQDSTPFINMIKNRPTLSLVPSINKRILAQRWGVTGAIFIGYTAIFSFIAYKYFLDIASLELVKTKKQFTFESDPFTGKVKCNYFDAPNKLYGFWFQNDWFFCNRKSFINYPPFSITKHVVWNKCKKEY